MADGRGMVQTGGGAPPARIVVAGLPTRLRAAAMEASGQPYGQAMTARPEHIRDARDALPRLKASLAGASDKHRIAILVGLADVVGMPEVLRIGNDGAQANFWRLYHATLANVPADVLQGAVEAFLAQPPDSQGRKFFPEPGTLLAIARRDYDWADNLQILRGLQRLSVAKPDGPRSYIGSEAVERELSERLAGAIKRIDAAEMAGAESVARPYDPARWDDAGRKSLSDVERNRGVA